MGATFVFHPAIYKHKSILRTKLVTDKFGNMTQYTQLYIANNIVFVFLVALSSINNHTPYECARASGHHETAPFFINLWMYVKFIASQMCLWQRPRLSRHSPKVYKFSNWAFIETPITLEANYARKQFEILLSAAVERKMWNEWSRWVCGNDSWACELIKWNKWACWWMDTSLL